jgi:hypothetical protein
MYKVCQRYALYYNDHAMDYVAIQAVSFRCNDRAFQRKLLLGNICARTSDLQGLIATRCTYTQRVP